MEGWEEYQWDPNEQRLENIKKENAKWHQIFVDMPYESLKRANNISPKIFEEFSKEKIIEVVNKIIQSRHDIIRKKIQALFPRKRLMSLKDRNRRKLNIAKARHREENKIDYTITYQDFKDKL